MHLVKYLLLVLVCVLILLGDPFICARKCSLDQAGATVPARWCLYRRLKIFAVVASFVSFGRLFHSFITIVLNKLLLNSWRHRFFNPY